MASSDQIKFCPQCGAKRMGDAWSCACGHEFDAGPERQRRRRHRRAEFLVEPPEAERRLHRSRPRRRGPLFVTIWFCLLSLHWVLLMALIFYVHRNTMNLADKFVGSIGCMLALFYLWVAYGVYCRRRYIWDIAMVCAGIWLLIIPAASLIAMLVYGNFVSMVAVPTGILFGLLVFGSLLSSKSDFTR